MGVVLRHTIVIEDTPTGIAVAKEPARCAIGFTDYAGWRGCGADARPNP